MQVVTGPVLPSFAQKEGVRGFLGGFVVVQIWDRVLEDEVYTDSSVTNPQKDTVSTTPYQGPPGKLFRVEADPECADPEDRTMLRIVEQAWLRKIGQRGLRGIGDQRRSR